MAFTERRHSIEINMWICETGMAGSQKSTQFDRSRKKVVPTGLVTVMKNPLALV